MCLTSYLVLPLNFDSIRVHRRTTCVWELRGVRDSAQAHGKRWTPMTSKPKFILMNGERLRLLLAYKALHVIGWHTCVCIRTALSTSAITQLPDAWKPTMVVPIPFLTCSKQFFRIFRSLERTQHFAFKHTHTHAAYGIAVKVFRYSFVGVFGAGRRQRETSAEAFDYRARKRIRVRAKFYKINKRQFAGIRVTNTMCFPFTPRAYYVKQLEQIHNFRHLCD